MQTPFPNSSDFRAQAREALRPQLTAALTITFLASLPELIASTVRSLTTSSFFTQAQTLLLQANAGGSGRTVEQLLESLEQVFYSALADRGVQVAIGLSVLVFLVTPFLSLGMMASVLRMLRKEEVSAASVLSRSGSFFKALGLRLYMGLRIALWLLPGLALSLLSIPALVKTRQLAVFYACYGGGLAVMVALGLRAALHYALSELLLADHPDAKVTDALHDSVLIMRRRKKYLVAVYAFFIVLMMVSTMVTNMLSGLSYVLALVVDMAADLCIQLYLATTVAAFYMHYEKQPLQM